MLRVKGLGFGVKGFRVWGLGVSILGFGVWGFRVLGFERRVWEDLKTQTQTLNPKAPTLASPPRYRPPPNPDSNQTSRNPSSRLMKHKEQTTKAQGPTSHDSKGLLN